MIVTVEVLLLAIPPETWKTGAILVTDTVAGKFLALTVPVLMARGAVSAKAEASVRTGVKQTHGATPMIVLLEQVKDEEANRIVAKMQTLGEMPVTATLEVPLQLTIVMLRAAVDIDVAARIASVLLGTTAAEESGQQSEKSALQVGVMPRNGAPGVRKVLLMSPLPPVMAEVAIGEVPMSIKMPGIALTTVLSGVAQTIARELGTLQARLPITAAAATGGAVQMSASILLRALNQASTCVALIDILAAAVATMDKSLNPPATIATLVTLSFGAPPVTATGGVRTNMVAIVLVSEITDAGKQLQSMTATVTIIGTEAVTASAVRMLIMPVGIL
jgi:hypothetical protein